VHRFDGVLDQIQNDLLQLRRIAREDEWHCAFAEIYIDDDVLRFDRTCHDRKDLFDQFVQIERFSDVRLLFEHSPNIFDEITSAMGLFNHLFDRNSSLLKIRNVSSDPSESCASEGGDGMPTVGGFRERSKRSVPQPSQSDSFARVGRGAVATEPPPLCGADAREEDRRSAESATAMQRR
jgi:hypothetical protein